MKTTFKGSKKAPENPCIKKQTKDTSGQKAQQTNSEKKETKRLSTEFQRCSLIEHEQQQQVKELIIGSTPIADFQKEFIRKDKTLTLEETLSIGKTYGASNIHIKRLRAMVNYNNVDNTNIQAIRTLTRSTMSNKYLKCGKRHAFHREACLAFGSKCNTRG